MLFSLVLISLLCPSSFAQQFGGNQFMYSDRPHPYTACKVSDASEIKDLPKDFYGSWVITTKTLDTNKKFGHSRAGEYRDDSKVTYKFRKNGDDIIIASSDDNIPIQILKVEGNTLTYCRCQRDLNMSQVLTVELTVTGNTIAGTSKREFNYLDKKGNIEKSDFSLKSVYGTRVESTKK